MQPPPRKVKHTISLKKTHAEQLSKLQTKHQHELDIIEDIRLFTKQRSVIEKEYAQALCKLAQSFLTKRPFPPPPDINNKDGKEHKKTIATVWKTVLEETDRVGRTRVQAAETYHNQISETIKPVKTAKAHVAKKVFEQARTLQTEISQTVAELTRSQKIYHDEEHISYEARTKANDVESKLKNKNTGLFTSLSSLQKNSAKLNTRRDACEIKSTAARNEYLLNMAASNAHQIRFYSTDLPDLIKMLDGDMYDKLRDAFITLARTELECCGLTQECFMKIMSDSALISRQYNLECFLHENLVFTDLIQYQFEPQDNDAITKCNTDHEQKGPLAKEAQKWAAKVAKDNRVIRTCNRQIHHLQEQIASGTAKSEEGKEGEPKLDPEAKMEDLQANIRKAETGKMKAEARLEALRLGGVNIDEYLNSAMAEQLAAEEEEEKSQRSSSSMSIKTDSSEHRTTDHAALEKKMSNRSSNLSSTSSEPQKPNPVPTSAEAAPAAAKTSAKASTSKCSLGASSSARHSRTSVTSSEQREVSVSSEQQRASVSSEQFRSRNQSAVEEAETHTAPPVNDSTYINYEEDDYVDDTFEATAAATAAATPPEEEEAVQPTERGKSGYSSGRQYPLRCLALYDFEATNNDEITMLEGEKLQLVADGDGDGWVRAQKEDGTLGFIPENYVQLIDIPTNGVQDVEDENEMNVDGDMTTSYNGIGTSPNSTTGRMSAYSATDYEVQQLAGEQPTADQSTVMEGNWVRALYDYEATSEEELTFQEGQLIKILRKDGGGVDDGWWEGEVNGRIGVFPSLVVEELNSEELASEGSVTSPVGGGPPAYTPPEPGPLPPQLEITHPTPSDEMPPSSPPGKPGYNGYHVLSYWSSHHRPRESTV